MGLAHCAYTSSCDDAAPKQASNLNYAPSMVNLAKLQLEENIDSDIDVEGLIEKASALGMPQAKALLEEKSSS